jgi:transcriptional regulator with PAS, ATPase and Fis domain
MDALLQFDWPGNVRELQNEMERGTTLARDGDRIGVAHLSAKLRRPAREHGESTGFDNRPLREARAEFEARHIAGVLERHDGNGSPTPPRCSASPRHAAAKDEGPGPR